MFHVFDVSNIFDVSDLSDVSDACDGDLIYLMYLIHLIYLICLPCEPQGVTIVDSAPDASSPEEREPRRRLKSLQETLGLSDAEEQIIGKPWNYQQKYDAKQFFKSVEWAPTVYNLPDGVCDV